MVENAGFSNFLLVKLVEGVRARCNFNNATRVKAKFIHLLNGFRVFVFDELINNVLQIEFYIMWKSNF